MPDRFLSTEGVNVAYGRGGSRCTALADTSVAFARGQFTLVRGPSGSGKTTLLSIIGCLLKPDSGSVYVDGIEVSRLSESKRTSIRRDKIGFIFQAFRLFSTLGALDNVAIAGSVAGERFRKRARQLLEELGLGNRLHHKPGELSGGEKQRVAIARALLRNPPIVLADEPTASLDSNAGHQISEILRDLAAKQDRTVVVVSHDPRWESFADNIVVMADGLIVGSGVTEINWQLIRRRT